MDKYCLPIKYKINKNNLHFDDTKYPNDECQKEVYIYVKKFMKDKNLKKIIDIGCGSGFKLIKYLGEFDTIGIETEPCISFLKKKYPNNIWINSGEMEKSFNIKDIDLEKEYDIVMSSDVIEHIRDPDELIKFMKKIKSKYYLLSTPCRQVLFDKKLRTFYGPPGNKAHVREWTFNEFKMYLNKYFEILDSKKGEFQISCQWHLLANK